MNGLERCGIAFVTDLLIIRRLFNRFRYMKVKFLLTTSKKNKNLLAVTKWRLFVRRHSFYNAVQILITINNSEDTAK